MKFHLPRAAIAAVGAAALVLPAASAASALELPPPVVQIVSPAPDDLGTFSGPFTLGVSVDLAGNPSIDLSPQVTFGGNDLPVATRTVTAEQCPQQCIITFEVNPTTWESPQPSTLFGRLAVISSWAQSSSVVYREFDYVAPVEGASVITRERDDTPNTRGYRPIVVDTGVSLVVSGFGTRAAGEVLEARVYTGEWFEPLPTPVLTATGAWDPSAQSPTGRIRLETTSLAAGIYRLLVRARDTEGHYGPGYASTLTIRHRPVVEMDPVRPFLLAGSDLWVSASVMRPLPEGAVPHTIQISVDGRPAQILPVPWWNNINSTSPEAHENPIQGSAPVLGALLPAGVRTVTTQVLDTHGLPLGLPATGQVRVVTLTEQASVPTLVVGQTSAVTFSGTTPLGMTYDSCSFFLRERGFTVAGGGLCGSGDTSYLRSLAWTPQTAGPGEVEFSVRTEQGVDSPARRIPVTVYAHRTASIGAVSSAYGTRPAATVTVRDLTNLTSPTVAASGASVVLQRKAAGTSTWVGVGSGRTSSAGRALIPFTNTANGRLRAVVASSVPGRSVVTSERTVTSVSTVAWSSLPRSTRSGAPAYASVKARPYQRGALVRVQARRPGASSWKTFGSRSVSSNGAARAGFRLYARGTWQVRVVRVATTLRATGYSTVRRVRVW